MRYFLRGLGLILGYEPQFYRRKRNDLSRRLHRMFKQDWLEATLNCAVRSALK